LDIIPDSGSDRAFDRATKWLSHCLSHDEKCGNTVSTYMPRRLLNLGLSTDNQDLILFEPTKPVPYACLSYCWGPETDDVLKTTTRTLKTHYQGIRLSSLPKTIHDAVIFCRGLKLQYLWVDSLCIVQDDVRSWLVDSAQMHEIYSNALLTLAIEEPASCKTGFLGKQQFGPEWQQKLVIEDLPEARGSGKVFFIRSSISHLPHVPRCSLDQRGWCLQESILSKRRLCFDGNEMTWECAHRRICECGYTYWVQRPIDFVQLGYLLKQPSQNTFGLWRQLVEEYSARHLTDDGDKLVAISALAKLFHSVFRNSKGEPPTYLAGVWREDFLYDITWSVDQSENHSYPRKLASQYRAPTWSWASVDMPVQYKPGKNIFLPKHRAKRLLDCNIDDVVSVPFLASDPTGPVSSAYAQVTAQLACVCKEGLQQATDIYPDRPDEFYRWGEAQTPCRRQCCRNSEGQDELQSLRVNASYYLLRLFTYVSSRRVIPSTRMNYMDPEIWFLILKDSSIVEGAYERIGIGYWPPYSGEWDPNATYCPLFQGCKTRSIKIV
jgi:hypothetical protein